MGNSGYTNKGLYNSYDKNHKEREKKDYYATNPDEVINILEELNIDFSDCTILEPCVGGGHMANGIEEYLSANLFTNPDSIKCIGTDIQDRGYSNEAWELKYGLDFFADDYPINTADWVIMNPPYSIIEPFVIRALDIAEKGVIMLARLQFLEGSGRYEKILKDNPPTDVYVYVDRIQCWKNGIEPEGSSAQAYAWFVWNKENYNPWIKTQVHWLRRA